MHVNLSCRPRKCKKRYSRNWILSDLLHNYTHKYLGVKKTTTKTNRKIIDQTTLNCSVESQMDFILNKTRHEDIYRLIWLLYISIILVETVTHEARSDTLQMIFCQADVWTVRSASFVLPCFQGPMAEKIWKVDMKFQHRTAKNERHNLET